MKLNRRSLNGLRGIDLNSLMSQYGSEWGGLPPNILQKVLEVGFPGNIYGGSRGLFHERLGADMNQYGTRNGTIEMPQQAMAILTQRPDHYDNDGFPIGGRAYPNGEPVLANQDQYGNLTDLRYDPNAVHWEKRGNDSSGFFWYPTVQPALYNVYAGLFAGGNIQVTRNPFNGSWLSLGAAGGYRDPRLISWTDEWGLYTPISNYLLDYDSFWESWGPFILATLAIGGVAAGGIAAGAGGEAVATGAAESITTATAAETASITTSSTEAFTAGEEALREIGLAQSLGATVTQGEAAGWVAALSNAGLAVPADIASIASGAVQGVSSGSGYQSPPSPPSGGASSAGTSATSGSSLLTTAGQVVSNPLVKTAAGLIAIGAASGTTGNNPAPNAGYSYASPGMSVDYTKTRAQTAGSVAAGNGAAGSQPFNWIWLLVAGAGVYFVKQKMHKKGKHHAPK